MQLLEAWKDSFTIFKPRNFVNFVSDFATTYARTWITWVQYWLWLIATYLFAGIYGVFDTTDNLSTAFAVRGFARLYDSFAAHNIFASILLILLYITLYLSAKPLPARKSYAYFFFYIKETIILGLWFLILTGIWNGYRLLIKKIIMAESAGSVLSTINPLYVLLLSLNAFLLYLLFCFSSFYIVSVLNLMGNSFLSTQKKSIN